MKDADSKTIIIDASFALSFLLPDEKKTPATDIFTKYGEGKIGLFSSPILALEVTNGIKSAVKSKRIDKKTALNILKNFLEIKITYPQIDIIDILNLALKENLSVYDASYIWLSRKENLTLLTLDKKMQRLSK